MVSRSKARTLPRWSRVFILHQRRGRRMSCRCRRHVREPSQPVGTRRKYNNAALAPRVPSAYVVLDERAVTQKRLDPGPLAPACDLRPEISPRFHAGGIRAVGLLEYGAPSEDPPAGPSSLRLVLG